MAPLGRPRDPAVDDAALAAAVRLIVEQGYSGLTMERIAEHAGVSKAALYRRWPNKVELVVDAIAATAQRTLAVPDTGRVRDDIEALLAHASRERHADAVTHDALTAAVGSDPELAERCRRTLVQGMVAAFAVVVGRAVDRGELPADTDVEILSTVVPAMMLYRRQTTGRRPDPGYVLRVVEQVFRHPH